MIETIYKKLGFIIGFMVLTLIISMAFGEKAQRYFLLTTLFSVIILNNDSFDNMFSNLVNVNNTVSAKNYSTITGTDGFGGSGGKH